MKVTARIVTILAIVALLVTGSLATEVGLQNNAELSSEGKTAALYMQFQKLLADAAKCKPSETKCEVGTKTGEDFARSSATFAVFTNTSKDKATEMVKSWIKKQNAKNIDLKCFEESFSDKFDKYYDKFNKEKTDECKSDAKKSIKIHEDSKKSDTSEEVKKLKKSSKSSPKETSQESKKPSKQSNKKCKKFIVFSSVTYRN